MIFKKNFYNVSASALCTIWTGSRRWLITCSFGEKTSTPAFEVRVLLQYDFKGTNGCSLFLNICNSEFSVVIWVEISAKIYLKPYKYVITYKSPPNIIFQICRCCDLTLYVQIRIELMQLYKIVYNSFINGATTLKNLHNGKMME